MFQGSQSFRLFCVVDLKVLAIVPKQWESDAYMHVHIAKPHARKHAHTKIRYGLATSYVIFNSKLPSFNKIKMIKHKPVLQAY